MNKIKMKTLKSIRQAFAFIGYLPGDGKFRHKIVSLLIVLILFAFELTSVIYMVRHLQFGDIANSMFAGLEAAATLTEIGSLFSLMYHRKKVQRVFDGFQQICDRIIDKHKPSAVFFIQAEITSEQLLKYAFVGLNGGYILSSLIFVILDAIYHYIRDGHIESEKLFLPLKISTPFNEDSFIGWTCRLCVDMVLPPTCGFVHVSTVCFFVAIGLYFRACAIHFRLMLAGLINAMHKNTTIESRLQIKSSLIGAVNFHNDVRSIFDLVRDSMSGTIFFQLVAGVVFMSLNNFNLEAAMKKMDPTFFTCIIAVQSSTFTVLLYCFFGSLTTEQFRLYGDISYEFPWYKLPVEFQKYFPLIIANAQRPKIFTGFNILNLNLAAFTTGMKSAITFYMMFNHFAKLL